MCLLFGVFLFTFLDDRIALKSMDQKSTGIHGPNMASPPWSHDLLFQRFQLRISIPGADGAKKAPDSILIFKNSYMDIIWCVDVHNK